MRMFGKRPPKLNSRTLKLSKYLKSATPLPAPPAKNFWEYKSIAPNAWGMDANDTVGDCTCACIGHMVMMWTAHAGKLVIPTAEECLAVYSAVTGYNPNDPSTDQGAAITDVLNYLQNTGITVGGVVHKILAWAKIDQTNQQEVEQANYIFGGLDIGFNVPQSALDQNQAGEDWDVVADDGGIQGGHSVPVFGYGSEGATCVTWGALQGMSWAFFQKYCDEAYAIITEDWLSQAESLTPSGFDLAALQADLTALRA
jgi:hypothetical protein